MSQADVDLIRALIPPSETDVAALLRSDELWSQLVEGLKPWARYHSDIDELIDAGDCVVTIARDRGERPDVDGEVDILAGSTWEIRHGKVVRVVFYGNREDALAAAGVEQR